MKPLKTYSVLLPEEITDLKCAVQFALVNSCTSNPDPYHNTEITGPPAHQKKFPNIPFPF